MLIIDPYNDQFPVPLTAQPVEHRTDIASSPALWPETAKIMFIKNVSIRSSNEISLIWSHNWQNYSPTIGPQVAYTIEKPFLKKCL